MSFSRPSPESAHSIEPALHEAVLASVSSVRDSLPKEHHEHFNILRQEIIDFAASHDIPRELLSKPDALREAASKLPTSDLERLANLLERFKYLIVKKEPMKEKLSEAREYAEEFYHLEKQYTSQVALLEQAGILKEGAITGIDGKKYPIPTLEQIASRLFERRETLQTKHEQGFTKLLLVPFGMSLDVLIKTLDQFLLSYKQFHPTFAPKTNDSFLIQEEGYQGADTGNFPNLVYKPQSFTEDRHGGKTKAQILETQDNNPDSFNGWTVHLLQLSNPSDSNSLGFAFIPPQGKGKLQGDLTPRPPLEIGQSANEYFSTLQACKDKEDSPYSHESGMTLEDWIIAFMTHLQETGKPLDDIWNPTRIEGHSCFLGAVYSFISSVPCAYWDCNDQKVNNYRSRSGYLGIRTSVIV